MANMVAKRGIGSELVESGEDPETEACRDKGDKRNDISRWLQASRGLLEKTSGMHVGWRREEMEIFFFWDGERFFFERIVERKMKKKNEGSNYLLYEGDHERGRERASGSDRVIGLDMEQRRALSMATVAWLWRRPVTGDLRGHDPEFL